MPNGGKGREVIKAVCQHAKLVLVGDLAECSNAGFIDRILGVSPFDEFGGENQSGCDCGENRCVLHEQWQASLHLVNGYGTAIDGQPGKCKVPSILLCFFFFFFTVHHFVRASSFSTCRDQPGRFNVV